MARVTEENTPDQGEQSQRVCLDAKLRGTKAAASALGASLQPSADANPKWQVRTHMPPLVAGEVQIWRLQPSVIAPQYQRFWDLCLADEQTRANRFHQQADRERFVFARGGLRLLIANQLNCTPREIVLSIAETGKPYLPQHPMYFNLSHAGDVILFALSLDQPVGVDVEDASREVDVLSLVERFFHPAEYAMLKSLPEPAQKSTFYQLWTCKEAVVKTIGTGVSEVFADFAVELTQSAPRVVWVSDSPHAQSKIELKLLSPGKKYCGAIASLGNYRSTCLQWLVN